ncbi:MAG: phytoene/squalene synthase family protein [Armatimonadota bacterium]|nr:phytoene/squalene synthase family protein [Armatimonadota bacterium]MDW8155691.1 phytoene/squalene synthase family protein [Armatimonadota bacterium]
MIPGRDRRRRAHRRAPDWAAVAAVVRAHSATFYFASWLFPPTPRRGIWSVYAACRLGDDAVDEEGAGPWALQAWWDGILRAYRGQPRMTWEEALCWTVDRWQVPLRAFEEMREGFRMDLRPVRIRTEAELLTYCYRVAGTVGEMVAPIAGADESWVGAAASLGQAMQLTNILRDVGEDLRRDRVYLPQDLLARFGVREADLWAGRVTPEYQALMCYLDLRARRLYADGLRGLPGLRRGRAAVAFAALQYRAILDKLRDRGYDNLRERVSLTSAERVRLVPRSLTVAIRAGRWPQARPWYSGVS